MGNGNKNFTWQVKVVMSLEQIIDMLEKQKISLLSIQPAHIFGVLDLPFEHRDPFDRIMIAQCLHEKMKFITNEAMFINYGIDRVW